VVLGRDGYIVLGIGALKLARRHITIAPTRLSKYATFMQFVTLAVALAYWAANAQPTFFHTCVC